METVEYKNVSFTVWDVGGQDKVVKKHMNTNDYSFIIIKIRPLC